MKKSLVVITLTLLLGTPASLLAHDAGQAQVMHDRQLAHEAMLRAREQAREQAHIARERAMQERHQARRLLAQNQQQAVVREYAAQAREQAERDRERARQDREQAREEYQRAREELRAAANRVAELSADLSPARGYAFRFLTDANRAMLGVSISNDEDNTGVRLNSVSPGGPADEAGLQSNDVLLAINGVRLDDPELESPSRTVLEVMSELEPGDEVTLEYQRDGVIDDAVVVAERRAPLTFAPIAPLAPLPDSPPVAPHAPRIAGLFGGGFAAGLELVKLNPDLGNYFGTSQGLLVVSVPEDFPAEVRGGDVLLSIDGREPNDPHHAFRILRSYETGETVNLEVLRDRDELDISFEVPENRFMQGLGMFGGGKLLDGIDLGGSIRIHGLEGLQNLSPEDFESLHILKGLPGDLSDAISKDFETLMQDGFINGLHFEFRTDEDAPEPDGEWIQAEAEPEEPII